MTPEEIEAKKRSKALDSTVELDEKTDRNIKKLLLLGAGESGKSTLFKQAVKIYGKGYSAEERKSFHGTMIGNVVSSIQILAKMSSELRPPCPVQSKNQGALQIVQELKAEASSLTPQQANAIAALWKDEGIQQTYERRAEYQVNDSTEYFITKIDKLADPKYMPDEQDVLRVRIRTTGIVETTFLIDSNTFKMFDVGGQRNERKKWIHCFENVTSVLFVAAISEYDQKLYEDESCNRMSEALSLFDEIVNSRWFKDTSVILFLNKKDLFMSKIAKLPITVCPEFQDYDGPQEYEACCDYITDMFLEQYKHPKDKTQAPKQIFHHITTATDSENIRVVFEAVKLTIINDSLRRGGLL